MDVMKAKTQKIKIPSFVSRDVGVMIESFNSTLELVAEQTSQIPQIKEDITELKEDVAILKEDVGVLKVDVNVLKKDMREVKEDVGIIKMDIEQIKHDLKNKIDRNEFAILEHRVALLESRR